jgi:hypothetical protein
MSPAWSVSFAEGLSDVKAGAGQLLLDERAIHLGQVAPCFLGFASTGGRRRVWVRRGRVVMVGCGVGRSREGWR